MASWVTHLIIADVVLEKATWLCKHEFCVGNIAPDCNVENESWTKFTPSREVTHWMVGERKAAADCDRFYNEYIRKRDIKSEREASFLLGYYAHLITDAEFQRYIREPQRVAAIWKRIENHAELRGKSEGMERTYDSTKQLIDKNERSLDIYSIEREYLDDHPNSGYFTEILNLSTFPDYIDYFPKGAIVRKIGVMGYLPNKGKGHYSFIAMTREEYNVLLHRATELVVDALKRAIPPFCAGQRDRIKENIRMQKE